MKNSNKKISLIVILCILIAAFIYLAGNGYLNGTKTLFRPVYTQTFTGSLAAADTLEMQVQMWILEQGNKISLVSVKNNRSKIKNAEDDLIITVKYKERDY